LAGSAIAITIAGSTFTGGISNFGVIYGATGIVITSAKGVSIFDAGAIIGADGTAVEFKTSSDAFTLGPVMPSPATSSPG
jgi:hypothetical protein